MSFIKALQQFFSDNSDGFGRKVEIAEMKELTTQDKHDLSEMLQPFVPHTPYAPAS